MEARFKNTITERERERERSGGANEDQKRCLIVILRPYILNGH